jgi:hypothetical protein
VDKHIRCALTYLEVNDPVNEAGRSDMIMLDIVHLSI